MAASLMNVFKRAALESRGHLPPTFLLPWAAHLSTVSHATGDIPIPPQPSASAAPSLLTHSGAVSSQSTDSSDISFSSPPAHPDGSRQPLQLSPQLSLLLPALRAQTPHYITAHIHAKPYLLTVGDTLRLPFHMRGVNPGDTLRLDKATIFGSRDLTLKAPAPPEKARSVATASEPTAAQPERSGGAAPHFIPHIAKGKVSYLDDRLFVCRAVVMGVESEPMRVLEKTKRRQRHVKHVRSKHAHTVLKIKEIRLRTAEEIETGNLTS